MGESECYMGLLPIGAQVTIGRGRLDRHDLGEWYARLYVGGSCLRWSGDDPRIAVEALAVAYASEVVDRLEV